MVTIRARTQRAGGRCALKILGRTVTAAGGGRETRARGSVIVDDDDDDGRVNPLMICGLWTCRSGSLKIGQYTLKNR